MNPRVSDRELNALISAAWNGLAAEEGVVERLKRHSLAYLCAYEEDELVGFVNVAWDGGIHGFILDTSVHPDYRRQGVGVKLVQQAAKVAKERGLTWLHVDYEERLESFYGACGFTQTKAGLINLKSDEFLGVGKGFLTEPLTTKNSSSRR